MLYEHPLNTSEILSYAQKWAYVYNPSYCDFNDLGGDCTNFISQCLFAGGAAMNFTRDTGWYYNSLSDRAAAWTGVEYFYRFIVRNNDTGPFGHEIPLSEARVCDIIQLGSSEGFYHTLLVSGIKNGEFLLAAHTFDCFDRPLSSYSFKKARCLRIDGARRYV